MGNAAGFRSFDEISSGAGILLGSPTGSELEIADPDRFQPAIPRQRRKVHHKHG